MLHLIAKGISLMSNRSNRNLEIVIPILVYIQANLHEDLDLKVVAKKAGLSPFHFHRMFKNVVGETLKQYVLRIKLEKAAFALKYWDEKILSISNELGFKNPESFTRAFKREFQYTPKDYRQQFRKGELSLEERHSFLNQMTNVFEISPVTLKHVSPIDVAFIRNTGLYEDVDTRLFHKLIQWAKDKKIYRNDCFLLGVGHDAPTITPKELLRFDCCIEVDQPFHSEGKISYQQLEGGQFATVTYVGPYGMNMKHAYQKLYQEIQHNKNIEFVGLPVVEIYRTTTINPSYKLNQTDIYVPIRVK
ncbi:Transcriptional regulator, AraC [Bacillus pseudomycoides DSM 12442]|nr:Transcriptional regulator, AraC [Bacillus pseudomycoides DSM 12442]